jgi:hypothetical protein
MRGEPTSSGPSLYTCVLIRFSKSHYSLPLQLPQRMISIPSYQSAGKWVDPHLTQVPFTYRCRVGINFGHDRFFDSRIDSVDSRIGSKYPFRPSH